MLRGPIFTVLSILALSVRLLGGDGQNLQDKDAWLDLLYKKKFTELDRRLQEIYKQTKNDVTAESTLDNAFQAFYNSNPEVGNKIKEWKQSRPQSLFAQLAWAVYNEKLAYLSRGTALVRKTPPKRLLKMQAYLREADDTVREIVKKDPHFSVAYKYLLFGLLPNGSKERRQKVIDEALQFNPLSQAIRYTYLQHLEPKWGGTLKALRTFMDKTRKLYGKNPLLRKQEGYDDYVVADMLRFKQGFDKKEQLEYFNRAIAKNSSNARYYAARGDAYYYYWHNDQKAKQDFEKSLAINPQDTYLLTMLAKIALKNKLYKEAMKYIKRALRYDKLNPLALRTKGRIAFASDKLDEALLSFQDSLIYSGPNALAYKYMAHIYYRKKNYAMAAEYFLKSNTIKPLSPAEWYMLTVSQWHERDCAFVHSAYTYREICRTNHKGCTKKRLSWSIKSADFARNKGICPK